MITFQQVKKKVSPMAKMAFVTDIRGSAAQMKSPKGGLDDETHPTTGFWSPGSLSGHSGSDG